MNSRLSLTVLIRCCLLTLVLISPGRSQSPLGGSELIIEVADNTNHQTVTIEVRALGQVWDANFDKGEYPGDTISTAVDHPMLDFDHVTSINSDNPIIGFGLYEITIKVAGTPQITFRADFTDCLYPYGGGRWADLWFEYYLATGLLYETIIYNPPEEIVENETVHIWDNGNGLSGSPSTAYFQPTDPSDLTVSTSGNPTLSWTRSEPRASAKYIVYRNSTAITSPAISDSFYVDTDYWISQSGSNLEYKVRAVSGDGTKYSAGFSNTVNTKAISTEKLADKSTQASPSNRELFGAYPNPFNPQTTIRFTLPADTHAHVSVFDMLGRETVRLVDGNLEAGAHESVWKGEDAQGRPVPSGMYLYRIESAGGTRQGKMLLVR